MLSALFASQSAGKPSPFSLNQIQNPPGAVQNPPGTQRGTAATIPVPLDNTRGALAGAPPTHTVTQPPLTSTICALIPIHEYSKQPNSTPVDYNESGLGRQYLQFKQSLSQSLLETECHNGSVLRTGLGQLSTIDRIVPRPTVPPTSLTKPTKSQPQIQWQVASLKTPPPSLTADPQHHSSHAVIKECLKQVHGSGKSVIRDTWELAKMCGRDVRCVLAVLKTLGVFKTGSARERISGGLWEKVGLQPFPPPSTLSPSDSIPSWEQKHNTRLQILKSSYVPHSYPSPAEIKVEREIGLYTSEYKLVNLTDKKLETAVECCLTYLLETFPSEFFVKDGKVEMKGENPGLAIELCCRAIGEKIGEVERELEEKFGVWVDKEKIAAGEKKKEEEGAMEIDPNPTNNNTVAAPLDAAVEEHLRGRVREWLILNELGDRGVKERFKEQMMEVVQHIGVNGVNEEVAAVNRLFAKAVEPDILPYKIKSPYERVEDAQGNWEDPQKPANGFVRGQAVSDLAKKAKANASDNNKNTQLNNGLSRHTSYDEDDFPKAPILTKKRKSSTFMTQLGIGAEGLAGAAPMSEHTNFHDIPGMHVKEKSYGRGAPRFKQPRPSPRAGGVHADPEAMQAQMMDSLAHNGGAENVGSPPPANMPAPSHTVPVDWSDITCQFRVVNSEEIFGEDKGEKNIVSKNEELIAPTFRSIANTQDDITAPPTPGPMDEDLKDEAFLARHEVVLGGMREKIEVLRAARQGGRPAGRGGNSGLGAGF
ncbi:hypothetical protein TL16_g04406 [Triparma laevis f. inornata]|uniref:Uncharacterized protein n=2 Tax=Triparma laevis TaxID=1534972 RepID=A0A9W6ZKQ5_9STRA|nr:hypothetical protein TrLO_g6624 [Triparma laevis f. longispina]GMH66336.1 hypothetical protein TL16_g04406 [Triparma laevis f. inornata]